MALVQVSRFHPFDCYLVRYALDDAIAAAVLVDGGCACARWSLMLNGCHCETRWNDLLLTVRCDFGGNCHYAVAGCADDFDSDTTYRWDNYSTVNVVQNAETGFPDRLWP